MSQPHPELLVLAITLVTLALAPLASRLVARMGEQISGELDGGRSGEALDRHLDAMYGNHQDDEIAQMLEANAFVRGRATEDAQAAAHRILDGDAALREEIRDVVIALNEQRERRGKPRLDVDLEVARRLAQTLSSN